MIFITICVALYIIALIIVFYILMLNLNNRLSKLTDQVDELTRWAWKINDRLWPSNMKDETHDKTMN